GEAQRRRRVHPLREGEVVRRKGSTVVPRDAGLQLVRRLHATVWEHLPAVRVELREGGREVRLRRAAWVDECQVCVEQAPREVEGRAAPLPEPRGQGAGLNSNSADQRARRLGAAGRGLCRTRGGSGRAASEKKDARC